jgi:putative NIF3 family GTP cyclohydrolase 1 type 2
MIQIKDIIAFIEGLSSHPLNSDEGVQIGSPDLETKNILVCWMPTVNALERAKELEADLVLGHESLYFPYNAVMRKDNPPGWEVWPVNHGRREWFEEHRVSFLRVHGSLDQICIFEEFRKQLHLPAAAVQGSAYYVQRYDIPPCTVRELSDRVKSCTGMAHIRVAAPKGMEQTVSRIGLAWGGVGLFVNVASQATLQEIGCDCLIAGETDDYGFRFSSEAGIPMIETSHEISENAGLIYFTELLRRKFPDLVVNFYENHCPWQWA